MAGSLCVFSEPAASRQQQKICKYQSTHTFHDGDRSGDYAGVMATFDGEFDFFSSPVHGGLAFCNGGDRFEGHVKPDWHSVGNTTLYTAAVICFGGQTGSGF